MKEITEDFWKDSTFYPNSDSSKIDQLLQMVYEKREIDFFVFCLKLISSEPLICKETGFIDEFNFLKNVEPTKRRKLIKHPVYNAWFKQTARAQDDKLLLNKKLNEFGHIIKKALDEKELSNNLSIDGHIISIKRYAIDPLILEGAFPEYKLPNAERQRNFEREVVYPEKFFRENLKIALERIKFSWYEAYINFPRFVNTVVDMIDGEYTSYSSSEHTGVIFVSTDNSPLVALEEFLMHEFGHQILYYVMELDPIVKDEDKTIYKLPWSGNERDFYGYFHAFYIYILLTIYLKKVKHRSKREQQRIEKRIIHIINGLQQTVKIFEQTDNFTVCGQILFKNLKSKIEQIINDPEK